MRNRKWLLSLRILPFDNGFGGAHKFRDPSSSLAVCGGSHFPAPRRSLAMNTVGGLPAMSAARYEYRRWVAGYERNGLIGR
jgi:hypothetical protein